MSTPPPLNAILSREPSSGTLSPTASYLRREWEWIPADGGPHPVDRDGSLVIAVTAGRRVIRTEVDHYLVQVDRDELRPGIVSFLLENELDPDVHGPFRCTIGVGFDTCGCEAGWYGRRRARGPVCKHLDALRALIQQWGVS